MRVLMVEDNDGIFEYYARFFSTLLPMDSLEFARVGSVAAALEVLEEPWNVILMDYDLGMESVSVDDFKFRTGAHLIEFRRKIEQRSSQTPSWIIGISSSQASNTFLIRAGANSSFSKLHVIEIAALINEKIVEENKKGVNSA